MRESMFRALKPGGRLVVAEAIHETIRSATREVQVKDHEIAAECVAKELTADFRSSRRALPFRDPKHKGGFWLMIARKPRP